MVRSRLACLKHLSIALACLGLCVCSVEFALHVYDACAAGAGGDSERNACTASWTMHHVLKPDARIVVSNPDNGSEVEWRTNSLGLRGAEIDLPKPAGLYRIVCLGNESTLAGETSENETFCRRLQEMLSAISPVKIEVINAGRPQYGPLLSFLSLRHALLALSPDLVICNFDMSDIAADHRCRRYVRMNGTQPLYCPHPDLERQRTAAEKLWVERLQMWRHGKRGLGYVLGSESPSDDVRDIDSPQGAYAWLRDDAPDWSLYIEQTLSVIGEIARTCRRPGGEFVLAAIPCPWQVAAEASDGPGVRERAGVETNVRYGSRAPFDTLSGFAKKEDILFCDASVIFSRVERPERLYFKNAPRFSATGHELYARVLGRFLSRNVVGPWTSGGPTKSGADAQFSGTSSRDTRGIRRTEFRRDEVSDGDEEIARSQPKEARLKRANPPSRDAEVDRSAESEEDSAKRGGGAAP